MGQAVVSLFAVILSRAICKEIFQCHLHKLYKKKRYFKSRIFVWRRMEVKARACVRTISSQSPTGIAKSISNGNQIVGRKSMEREVPTENLNRQIKGNYLAELRK